MGRRLRDEGYERAPLFRGGAWLVRIAIDKAERRDLAFVAREAGYRGHGARSQLVRDLLLSDLGARMRIPADSGIRSRLRRWEVQIKLGEDDMRILDEVARDHGVPPAEYVRAVIMLSVGQSVSDFGQGRVGERSRKASSGSRTRSR